MRSEGGGMRIQATFLQCCCQGLSLKEGVGGGGDDNIRVVEEFSDTGARQLASIFLIGLASLIFTRLSFLIVALLIITPHSVEPFADGLAWTTVQM